MHHTTFRSIRLGILPVLALSTTVPVAAEPLIDLAPMLFRSDVNGIPESTYYGNGLVSGFAEPLATLAETIPPDHLITVEFAEIFNVNDGYWDDFENGCGGPYVEADSGIIRIYDRDGFGADEDCPWTLAGGEVLLEMTVSYLQLLLGSPGCSYALGSIQFVGGAWFVAVSTDGVGWEGSIEGNAGEISHDIFCEIDGRTWFAFAESDMLFDVILPTPTDEVTWTQLKHRYR